MAGHKQVPSGGHALLVVSDRRFGGLRDYIWNSTHVRALSDYPTAASLRLVRAEGASRDLATDHIIAATGYRFAAPALPFISDSLLRNLRCVEQVPLLSRVNPP